MKKKRKKRSYFAIAIVVLFLCGLVTYQKYELIDTLEQNQKQLDALEERKKGLLKEREEISDYEDYVQTKKYVEEIAREKLGLVYEDEIIFQSEK
ncbi:MAG TPA: cell division protein FtsH [Lachnospiraceae bacterium]|nr:septum formation initiator family protein [uncultured Lachnoclostridium sp.]HAU87895.1 cell division protein FtsH [Lachnospiraceae bacterium]